MVHKTSTVDKTHKVSKKQSCIRVTVKIKGKVVPVFN